jgi:hypothetical protein
MKKSNLLAFALLVLLLCLLPFLTDEGPLDNDFGKRLKTPPTRVGAAHDEGGGGVDKLIPDLVHGREAVTTEDTSGEVAQRQGIRVVDSNFVPVPEVTLLALRSEGIWNSGAEDGVITGEFLDHLDEPYLIWAPSFESLKVEQLSLVTILNPSSTFLGEFVDSTDDKPVAGIEVRPFHPHRVSRKNMFRMIDENSVEPKLMDVSDAKGQFELGFSTAYRSAPRLELTFPNGQVEIADLDFNQPWQRQPNGRWQIPVQSQESPPATLRFVNALDGQAWANKAVTLFRDGRRIHLQSNAQGEVSVPFSRLGDFSIDDWPLSAAQIQLDQNSNWIFGWNQMGEVRLSSPVTVEVDPRPVQVALQNPTTGFEFGVIVTRKAKFFHWPKPSEILWLPAPNETVHEIKQGFRGPLNQVILRHVASGIPVDQAYAKPGELVSLACSQLGKVLFRGRRGLEAYELDWKVSPSGELRARVKRFYAAAEFSASQKEMELPVGEYVVEAFVHGALVFATRLEISAYNEPIEVQLAESAGFQTVQVEGSLSGKIPAVTVETVTAEGRKIDSAETDLSGQAELFFDGSPGAKVRVIWPAGQVNSVDMGSMDCKLEFEVESIEAPLHLAIPESVLGLSVVGDPPGVTLQLELYAEEIGVDLSFAELQIDQPVSLHLPRGMGKVSIKYVKLKDLSRSFDTTSGNRTNCALNLGDYSLLRVAIDVEGEGAFVGKIQTQVAQEESTQLLSRHQFRLVENDETKLHNVLRKTTGPSTLSISGFVAQHDKRWKLEYQVDLQTTQLMATGRVRIIMDETASRVILTSN